MKKILVILGIFTLGLALVGCTGKSEVVTPPSLVSIMVNEEAPLENGVFKLFYQAKSETVIVKVTLNNPENLEITSIVINGNNYRSHNFINNSSRSVMYFELNTGSQLGEKTWTINEIVYKDGDNSESVREFSVNEKFKSYVYKEVPTVVRENYTLYRESISVDFKITDSDSVVNEGTLKAQLFAGETLVEEQVLTDGIITVVFDGLLSDKQYEVKVKGTYDLDDTNGTLTNVILYSGSFTTLANGIPSAEIKNIVVTSNKVVFDIDFSDKDSVVVPGGLSIGIFQGDLLVDEISINGSVTGVGFEDLLNDNIYELKVLGDYDLQNGLGIQENSVLMIHSFSTLPKEVPTP